VGDWAGVLVAVVLLLANAFFVGAEFALISARRSAIEARAGSWAGRVTLHAMERVSLMMAGAQLGITVCSLGLGALGEPALAHLLEPLLPAPVRHPVAFALALAAVVFLHVVVGEMVPKNITLAGPDRAALLLGPPLAGTDVRLAPLDGHDELGDDGLGVVEARGPGLFDGYLHRPPRDGWFATGDIGRFTPSGALALVGRQATDLIKSGGYKIGAGEVENALLEHPAVAEAAVLGLPDDDLGERVVAVVVPAGEPPAARVLIDHVAALLAPHKRPREVRYVEELPRNDMGKVVKARLRE